MALFSTANGMIFYEVLGSKDAPWLTLIHNFMSTGRAAWGPLLKRLTQTYRVLLPDMPGHGKSIGHPPNYNHSIMAEQLAGLMEQQGALSGHLAGCSSGGMVAQLMVQNELIEPASLTLVSTTYSVNPETTGNSARLTPDNFIFGKRWKEGTARLHDKTQGENYFFRVLLPGFRELTPENSIDLQLTDLAGWSLPVCLVQGEQDEFFPSFVVEQMASAIPDAKLHLIPEQTHALLFRQPQVVSDIMVKFLENSENRQLPRARNVSLS